MATYGCNVHVTLSPADAMSCVVNFLMSSADSCVGMLYLSSMLRTVLLTWCNTLMLLNFIVVYFERGFELSILRQLY